MRVLHILIAITTTILLTACGGGGGGGGTAIGGGTIQIQITDCATGSVGTDDCGSGSDHYTCMQANDTIVQNTDDTVVTIVENETRKICVVSGAAHLLR